MNCRIRMSTGTRRRNPALLAAIVLGISLVGGASLAVDFTQSPSEFDITTDGIFTGPDEWSDVTPAVRLNGQSFVYTSADPDLDALYLMYDLPSSVPALSFGSMAGSTGRSPYLARVVGLRLVCVFLTQQSGNRWLS